MFYTLTQRIFGTNNQREKDEKTTVPLLVSSGLLTGQ